MKKILTVVFTTIFVSCLIAQSDSIVSKVYKWKGLKAEQLKDINKKEIFKGVTYGLKDFDVYAETIDPGKSQKIKNDYETLIIFKRRRT